MARALRDDYSPALPPDPRWEPTGAGGEVWVALVAIVGGSFLIAYRGAIWLAMTYETARSLDIDPTGHTRSDPGWFRPKPFVFRADSAETTLELWSRAEGACGPLIDDLALRAAQ